MKLILALLPALFLLTGCESMKEKIGLLHHTPNEFETVKNAPLEIPKTLSVRDPETLKPRKKKSSAERAREILKIGATKDSGPHKAEQNLLKRIGAHKRDKNIRKKIDPKPKEETFHDKIQSTLVFWKKPPPKGDVIDPREEKKKLQKKR